LLEMTAFQNPGEEAIKRLLAQVRTIAVVGLSPKAGRPSFQVAQHMQRLGYRIIPVRPGVDSVLGEKAYASLADIPAKPDLVDVFRAPEHVDAIVDACIRLGLPRLWLQDGVVNESAAQRARAAGIEVVMNRCVWRDYLQFFGPAPRAPVQGP
jgi:predicted CoA-binding protein